ncbi:MAG: hypothetical protein HC857_16775 [Synechococcales cyanobacterium RU_4_20]|nr:hypothetical protein [Synechococcales cyanobacterium RU_4_20]
MTKAVEKHAGTRPKVYLSDALSPVAKVRTLEETIRLETRTKILNPKWHLGMLKHGFSGVAEIEHQPALHAPRGRKHPAPDQRIEQAAHVLPEPEGKRALLSPSESPMAARIGGITPNGMRDISSPP